MNWRQASICSWNDRELSIGHCPCHFEHQETIGSITIKDRLTSTRWAMSIVLVPRREVSIATRSSWLPKRSLKDDRLSVRPRKSTDEHLLVTKRIDQAPLVLLTPFSPCSPYRSFKSLHLLSSFQVFQLAHCDDQGCQIFRFLRKFSAFWSFFRGFSAFPLFPAFRDRRLKFTMKYFMQRDISWINQSSLCKTAMVLKTSALHICTIRSRKFLRKREQLISLVVGRVRQPIHCQRKLQLIHSLLASHRSLHLSIKDRNPAVR